MAELKLQTGVLNGRIVPRLVDQRPLGSDATLGEAIDKGYVVGTKELVKTQNESVLRCIANRIGETGDGRKVDGILSVNAFPTGRVPSMTDEYDGKNVVLRARILKECQKLVKSENYTVTIIGAKGELSIDTISTGEATGKIVLGPGKTDDIAINGKELSMGDGDTITWSIPETGESGTVDATEATSDETRITIDAAALSALATPAHDGKTIVFTVTIMERKAVKKATLRYIA